MADFLHSFSTNFYLHNFPGVSNTSDIVIKEQIQLIDPYRKIYLVLYWNLASRTADEKNIGIPISNINFELIPLGRLRFWHFSRWVLHIQSEGSSCPVWCLDRFRRFDVSSRIRIRAVRHQGGRSINKIYMKTFIYPALKTLGIESDDSEMHDIKK